MILIISINIYAHPDSIKQGEMMLSWVVEKKPEFIGGQEALNKDIVTKAIYSRKAMNDSATGTVFVTF